MYVRDLNEQLQKIGAVEGLIMNGAEVSQAEKNCNWTSLTQLSWKDLQDSFPPFLGIQAQLISRTVGLKRKTAGL
jgi:hypothetical protein